MNKILLSGSLLVAGCMVHAAYAANSSALFTLHERMNPVQQQVQKPSVAPAYHQQLDTQLLGITVTTSPYLGLRSAYDGSDLVVNVPTMNEDLRLLQQRAKIEQALGNAGLAAQRPQLELSGKIQGLASSMWPYAGATRSDINLDDLQLDFLISASNWATGFITVSYDNGLSFAGGGTRITHSNVFIQRGWVTLGDLTRSPFYFTIGQMYVPFGRYANRMITAPVTERMFRVNQRAALIGYNNYGIYAEAYAFRGALRQQDISEYGFNTGYHFTDVEGFSGGLGVGYISDIAESQGMQNGPAPVASTSTTFSGFGATPGTEFLFKQVPGFDAHASLAYHPLSVNVEFVTALDHFDGRNFAFDGKGAAPRAANIESSYDFTVLEKPTSVSLGYGHTWEALALHQPENEIYALLNAAIVKNTIASIEYRHDFNYGAANTANGNCAGAARGSCTPITVPGSSQNVVLGEVSLYW